jgi:predicted phage terminase large subunit-like protein
MDKYQSELLIECAYKHFGDDAELLLKEHNWTGASGVRRMLGEIDNEYFCKAYLADQFDRKLGTYAIEILDTLGEAIVSDVQEKIAVIAPREHGKSTISTFAIPIKSALYKLKNFIFYISSNGETAGNFLEKTKKALESNAIVEDFGTQRGRIWNADNICLRNGVWIACTGWKSGIRGINKDTRPDLIILDDLEDKATIESDSLKMKLENCFREEIGRLGYYKTDFFYIGTLLCHDSLLQRISQEPAWKRMFFKCVIDFPTDEGEKLWETWRTIFRNIYNENRMEDAYEFYCANKEAMIEGVKVLWPGRFPNSKMRYKGSYYNIMLEREAWGEDAFWKEAQNEPKNSAHNKFQNLVFWDEWPKEIDTLKLSIDPSEGKGDSTAYCCLGEMNGGYFIKEGMKSLHTPYNIMDEVVRFIKDYPQIDEIILESNLFKDLLRDELIKKLIENDCYRTVLNKHASENKHIRIMQMEPDINGQKVFFNKINVAFNEEVRNYSKLANHDDCADALQIGWSKLKKPNFIIG